MEELFQVSYSRERYMLKPTLRAVLGVMSKTQSQIAKGEEHSFSRTIQNFSSPYLLLSSSYLKYNQR